MSNLNPRDGGESADVFDHVRKLAEILSLIPNYKDQRSMAFELAKVTVDSAEAIRVRKANRKALATKTAQSSSSSSLSEEEPSK